MTVPRVKILGSVTKSLASWINNHHAARGVILYSPSCKFLLEPLHGLMMLKTLGYILLPFLRNSRETNPIEGTEGIISVVSRILTVLEHWLLQKPCPSIDKNWTGKTLMQGSPLGELQWYFHGTACWCALAWRGASQLVCFDLQNLKSDLARLWDKERWHY